MKKKNLLASCLAMVLVLSMLAGCSSGTSGNSATGD